MTFIERVEIARDKKRKSKKPSENKKASIYAIGQQIGKNAPAVSKLLNNKLTMTLRDAIIIANYLGIRDKISNFDI